MNQTGKILMYMSNHGSINPIEALSDLGCFRLAARVCDLRDMGYEVKTTMVTKKNRYGEPVSFASYSLEAR
jgi:hypothetical protein